MIQRSLPLSLFVVLLLTGCACSKDSSSAPAEAEPSAASEPTPQATVPSPATEAPVETAPEAAGTETPPAPPLETASTDTPPAPPLETASTDTPPAPPLGNEKPGLVAGQPAELDHTIQFDPPTPVRPGVTAANSRFLPPMFPRAHSNRAIEASAADVPRPAANPTGRPNVSRPPKTPSPSRPRSDLTVTPQSGEDYIAAPAADVPRAAADPRTMNYFTAPAPPRIPAGNPSASGEQPANPVPPAEKPATPPRAGAEPPTTPSADTPPPAADTPAATPPATASVALCEKAHANIVRVLTAAEAPLQVLNRLSSDKAGFLAQCGTQPETVVRCVGDAPDNATMQRCSDQQPNARPPNQALRPLCEQAYDNATRLLLASDQVPEDAAEQMRDRRDDAINECLRENETNIRCIAAATSVEGIQDCNRPAQRAPDPALRPACEAAFETFVRVAQPGPDMPQEVVDRLPSQKDDFINGCLLQPASIPECMKAATTLEAFRECAAPPAPPTRPTRPTPAPPAAPTPAPGQ